jgi:hypothetical protein
MTTRDERLIRDIYSRSLIKEHQLPNMDDLLKDPMQKKAEEHIKQSMLADLQVAKESIEEEQGFYPTIKEKMLNKINQIVQLVKTKQKLPFPFQSREEFRQNLIQYVSFVDENYLQNEVEAAIAGLKELLSSTYPDSKSIQEIDRLLQLVQNKKPLPFPVDYENFNNFKFKKSLIDYLRSYMGNQSQEE